MPVWLTECIICSLHVSPLFSSLISNQTENTETSNFHSKMYERLIIANVSNITIVLFSGQYHRKRLVMVKNKNCKHYGPNQALLIKTCGIKAMYA